MRLDALIIFSIEWNSYELILRGKQLKYWGQQIGKITKTCALMHWSFLVLNEIHTRLFWGVNSRNTRAKKYVFFGGLQDRLRRGALRPFSSLPFMSNRILSFAHVNMFAWPRGTCSHVRAPSRPSQAPHFRHGLMLWLKPAAPWLLRGCATGWCQRPLRQSVGQMHPWNRSNKFK